MTLHRIDCFRASRKSALEICDTYVELVSLPPVTVIETVSLLFEATATSLAVMAIGREGVAHAESMDTSATAQNKYFSMAGYFLKIASRVSATIFSLERRWSDGRYDSLLARIARVLPSRTWMLSRIMYIVISHIHRST